MNIGDLGFKQADQVIIILATILAIPIMILIIQAIIVRKNKLDPNYFFLYLLAGNSIITVMLAAIFHMNYPETRMAIYFYPLIIGSIVFTIDILVKQTSQSVLVLFALPLLYLPVHFVQNFNMEYSVWYKYCHIPFRFYDRIMENYKSGDFPPTVGGHGIQAYTWSAVVKKYDGICNLMETSQFPSYYTNYQIIELQYFKNWQLYYDTIDYDKISNLHLLRKKISDKTLPITEINSIDTKGPLRDEFFHIYQAHVSSFCGKILEVNYDFSIKSFKNPIIGMVVISIEDSLHNNLVYNNMQLNLLKDKWDGSLHNFQKTSILLVPENSTKMEILLWNIGQSEYSLENGRVKIREIVHQLKE